MQEVKHCTKELVVSRNNRTYYLQYGSRVVQDYYQRVDCELEDLGNIIQAKKMDGTSIYIMQQETVREFSGEMHFLAEEPLLMKTPLKLDSVLDYASFNTSGLYDNAFLEAKKNWLFRGEMYAAMEHGVTTSFVQSTNWREAAENEIKLFDFIETNALITFLFGGYYWRLMIQFLQIQGYLSGLKMLCGICRNLLRRFLRKWLGLNRNERITIQKIRNRQYRQSNNWHKVMLTMQDGPPPYDCDI